ncbi:MAG TPA: DNA gyrase inhibitor YacG [Nitrospira sp.]|nr:DNA gyrase inhibitor YacG [Nitrospira sp.]
MTCPLCHRSARWEDNPWRPFCSERCQLTDLGTWAAEEYRVPGPGLTMELPSENSGEGDIPASGRRDDQTASQKNK